MQCTLHDIYLIYAASEGRKGMLRLWIGLVLGLFFCSLFEFGYIDKFNKYQWISRFAYTADTCAPSSSEIRRNNSKVLATVVSSHFRRNQWIVYQCLLCLADRNLEVPMICLSKMLHLHDCAPFPADVIKPVVQLHCTLEELNEFWIKYIYIHWIHTALVSLDNYLEACDCQHQCYSLCCHRFQISYLYSSSNETHFLVINVVGPYCDLWNY